MRKSYWAMRSRLFSASRRRWVLRSMEASRSLAVVIHRPSSFFSLPLSMGSLCSLGRSGLMLVRCSMIFDSGLVSSQW
ncbi:hypothetical protein D9M68_706480 [compost metagenome]